MAYCVVCVCVVCDMYVCVWCMYYVRGVCVVCVRQYAPASMADLEFSYVEIPGNMVTDEAHSLKLK